MTAPRIVTADDLCVALQARMDDDLANTVRLLGYTDLKRVTAWDQVPSLPALTSANVPVGAISSPGLVAPPKRRGDGTYDATWRLVVGLWDRDSSFSGTASRTRRWGAAIQVTVMGEESLGGLASSIAWVSEDYDEIPGRGSARTLGGCVVGFNVLVEKARDPAALLATTGPVVVSTDSTVSVKNS